MAMADPLPITVTQKELNDKWKALLGATLEAWAHMILYVRKVYDEDSFSSPKTNLFGLRLFQNRHPLVASYIADAVAIALPSIMAHVADSITLIITETPPPQEQEERPNMHLLSQAQQDSMSDEGEREDDDPMDHANDGASIDNEDDVDRKETKDLILPQAVVLEKYELRFPQQQVDSSYTANTVFTSSAIEYVEREMREILLSVYAMKDSDEGVSQSDSVSFRIALNIPEANATCPELNRAFAAGTWRTQPKPSGSFPDSKTPYVVRPMHSVDAMTCPVGPVHFSVKYPKAISTSKRRRGTPQKSQPLLSCDTQSTPTLDF